MSVGSSCQCPECGRRQSFLADEWPEQCACGYCFECRSVHSEYERCEE